MFKPGNAPGCGEEDSRILLWRRRSVKMQETINRDFRPNCRCMPTCISPSRWRAGIRTEIRFRSLRQRGSGSFDASRSRLSSARRIATFLDAAVRGRCIWRHHIRSRPARWRGTSWSMSRVRSGSWWGLSAEIVALSHSGFLARQSGTPSEPNARTPRDAGKSLWLVWPCRSALSAFAF